MDEDRKTTLTLAALAAAFATLAFAFFRSPARPARVQRPPVVAPQSLAGISPPGTVRISAGQLIRSGGDTSGLQCYACHNQKGPPPEITYDADHRIILPKEHADLIISMCNCVECHAASDPVTLQYTADNAVIIPESHRILASMRHGRNSRNENCFTCHDPEHLDRLHTPEGAELTLDQATQLCAGCHGPNYRDWEAGIHGRTSGFWDKSAGGIERQECTSCHDPHAPAFTGLIPMPPPVPPGHGSFSAVSASTAN